MTEPVQQREVLDVEQAAEYLGISVDTIYRYASESIMPAFKLGNRWRFRRSVLDAWMEAQENETAKQNSRRKAGKR